MKTTVVLLLVLIVFHVTVQAVESKREAILTLTEADAEKSLVDDPQLREKRQTMEKYKKYNNGNEKIKKKAKGEISAKYTLWPFRTQTTKPQTTKTQTTPAKNDCRYTGCWERINR